MCYSVSLSLEIDTVNGLVVCVRAVSYNNGFCRSLFKRIAYDRHFLPARLSCRNMLDWQDPDLVFCPKGSNTYSANLKDLADKIHLVTNKLDKSRVIFICSEECRTSRVVRSDLIIDLPRALQISSEEVSDDYWSYDVNGPSAKGESAAAEASEEEGCPTCNARFRNSNKWSSLCEWCGEGPASVCVLLLSKGMLCDWLCEAQITTGALVCLIDALPNCLCLQQLMQRSRLLQ